MARFAGAWIGVWRDKEREALCHTLVVEEILVNGYARLVVSHGTYADWNQRLPNFRHVTGRIVEGALRFRLPARGPKLVYEFAGETLTLRRIQAAIQLHLRGVRADGARPPRPRLRTVVPGRTARQVDFYATVEVAA